MEYSLDLRERVIAFIEQGGKKADASVLFNVSRPTINKWIKLKNETGSLKSPPLPPRTWRKINPEILIAHVNANPDNLLSDYATHLNVSNSGVWRALNRVNYTRKKRQLCTKNVTK
jgi:putative transposase